jgi:hypothetical protein
MKHIEKHFSFLIHRRDGASKLFLGVTGIQKRSRNVQQHA